MIKLLSGLLVATVLLLVWPASALGYTYQGPCTNSGSETTWDFTTYSTANTNGVEMDQYQIPTSSNWVTCTYQGSGFGHMMELLSLQGSSLDEIVQIGIAKFTGSQGVSWLFIYTPNDHSSGVVVDAGSLFGEQPTAGTTYLFHILSVVDPQSPTNLSWEYCIKNFSNSRRICWYEPEYWVAGSLSWYGGENATRNDTMGDRPQDDEFRTYAMRRHSTSGAWGSYFAQSFVNTHCQGEGFNLSIVNCNGETTNNFGGFYVWND